MTRCWVDVGPPSTTVDQHQPNIGQRGGHGNHGNGKHIIYLIGYFCIFVCLCILFDICKYFVYSMRSNIDTFTFKARNLTILICTRYAIDTLRGCIVYYFHAIVVLPQFNTMFFI